LHFPSKALSSPKIIFFPIMKENITPLYRVRHSLAHVLAQAVQKKFPQAQLGFGPPVEHGFYYDFDFGGQKITDADFEELQTLMRAIIKENQPFERFETHDGAEALAYLEAHMPGQTYKRQALETLISKGAAPYSFYKNGPFVDLCEGGHVVHTGELPFTAFKLDMLAGAYWLGSEKNPQLTRIYGLAFEQKEGLTEFLKRREMAEKFDHKVLGKELELFYFSDVVGKGLPLWMPNGTVIRDEIEKYAKEVEFRYGYQRVVTPHVTTKKLFLQSQHLPAYQDSMFPPLKVSTDEENEVEEYYLKPMNCPFHHTMYGARPRSYRELPVRFAEYGTCYRYEKSGEVSGLLRVRCLTMNDAHIYVAPSQFEEEFKRIVSMYMEMYKTFKLSNYSFRLSLRGEENKEKYKGSPEMWEKAEGLLRKVMDDLGLEYFVGEGEAAFYGPKIDIQFRNLMGREETVSTIQADFLAEKNFNLRFINEQGEEEAPIVIHRAPLSTHERFISYLIEYYGGAFPTWCAPTQVCVIPVNEECEAYAQEIAQLLGTHYVRATADLSSNSFNKKIRTNTVKKIPNLLIVGKNEAENRSVTLRRYGFEQQETLPLEDFTANLLREIQDRTMLREPMTALI
jgi:threonyl-tRNA synthetase